MTLALLAAAVLSTAAPPAPPAPDGEVARGAEASPRGHGGPRHALALGWHVLTLFSEEGSQYTFHSASVGWHGSWRARGPFVQLHAMLPLQARQDGRVYATGDYYHGRLGGSLLAGWQWRWTAFHRVEAEAGPGLHASAVWLPGRPGYRDFSALPVGVGAAGGLRWRPGARVLSRPLVLGAFGAAAYDLHDLLRPYDLRRGFAFQLGMTASVGARP